MLRSDTTSINWNKFNCFYDAKIPIIRNFLVKLGNVKNSDNQKLMYLTTWDREFGHFWVKIFQNWSIGFVNFYSLGHGQCFSFLLIHSPFHLHFLRFGMMHCSSIGFRGITTACGCWWQPFWLWPCRVIFYFPSPHFSSTYYKVLINNCG